MAWTYILRGDSGRHYIGSTNNLERRLKEQRSEATRTDGPRPGKPEQKTKAGTFGSDPAPVLI
ncbi:MAG: GIY-YIG nuclease family protein [Verrucomicrobiota bacterium]|jgi:hypothetical protein